MRRSRLYGGNGILTADDAREGRETVQWDKSLSHGRTAKTLRGVRGLLERRRGRVGSGGGSGRGSGRGGSREGGEDGSGRGSGAVDVEAVSGGEWVMRLVEEATPPTRRVPAQATAPPVLVAVDRTGRLGAWEPASSCADDLVAVSAFGLRRGTGRDGGGKAGDLFAKCSEQSQVGVVLEYRLTMLHFDP